MFYRKLKNAIGGMMLAGSLLVTGCGADQNLPSVQTSSKSSIIAANYRDLRDLNPHLYSGELFAQNLLFESLVRINNEGEIEPWLAEDWRISEDGKTYVFKLREDVSFSDGVKFDAQAAKANFDAILENAARHNWLESVELMDAVSRAGGKAVEVTGEYEITLRLAESYYPFLVDLGLIRPFRFISPNCFIEGGTKDGVSGLAGTGAYVLKENHVDEYAVFEANPNYWGEEPEIKEAIVKVIPDSQSRVMALLNGEIDLIFGKDMIDAETYLKLEDLEGYQTSISEPMSTRMLMMNTSHEILSDVRVRRAIQHGLNRELISQGIFDGIESPAQTLLAESVPYADLDLEPYEYNVETAENLLESAGWLKVQGKQYRQKEGQELRITLYYSNDSVEEKTLAQFFQYEMGKIGIAVKLVGEESEAHNARMKAGSLDITFNVSWGTPYDPQSFVSAMRTSAHGDYMAQKGLAEKAQIDDTILKVLKTTDEEERQADYDYILRTLHEEAVYVPLTYESNRAVYNERITKLEFGASLYEVPLAKMQIRQ